MNDAGVKSRLLLQHILKKTHAYIIANGNENINDEYKKHFLVGIKKIIKGVPIQYITNEQEFMKLNFYVDENVLIPQPDTEILVERIIKDYLDKQVKILDLCTGSGAIGISLAKYIKECEVTLTDISSKALQIAKLNAKKNLQHKKIKFIESDMFSKITNEKYDIIVSNPPYIKTAVIGNLEKNVQAEPFIALDGGQDGLKFYKIIAENAADFLKENGRIYLEIGYDQKDEVSEIINKTFLYKDCECIKDLSGNDRVIIAKKR